MGILRSIFGVDPPAPPGSGGGWTPTAAQRAAFLARHPMFAQRPAPPAPQAVALSSGAPLPSSGGSPVPSASSKSMAAPPNYAGIFSAAKQASSIAQGLGGLFPTGGDTSDPGLSATADISTGDSLNGELTIRHLPDGRVRIEHDPGVNMGAENDCDWADAYNDHCHYTDLGAFPYADAGSIDPFGWLDNAPGNFGYEDGGLSSPDDGIYVGESEPIAVEYHMSRTDAFGPTHAPYNFGGGRDEMGLEGSEMTETEGMPTGPVGSGPGSFGGPEKYGAAGPAWVHHAYPFWTPSVPTGYPRGDFDGTADKMGFEEEFISVDTECPALIFGSEFGCDIGCDSSMKG